MKIIGKIFEESDYTKFKRLPDNRDVLTGRLNKLIASISHKWILNPIIVNEKMEIIDGQGRFEALKSMGMPIPYIVAVGATSADCRMMNKYNTKWTKLDFAKSYAKAGLESYKLLLKTCEITELSIDKVLRLANTGGRAKLANEMSIFEKGLLNFDVAKMDMVINIKEKADDIENALAITIRTNDAFYTGVKVMTETKGYEHQKMLINCARERTTYNQMSNLEAQLKEFERIYNKGTRTTSRLYFSDYMRNRGYHSRNYNPSYSPYKDKDISTIKEDNNNE